MRLIEITMPEAVPGQGNAFTPIIPPFTESAKVDAEVADTEPPQGYIICPQCHGFGDYCADVAVCETCKGKIFIPAPLPPDTPKA